MSDTEPSERVRRDPPARRGPIRNVLTPQPPHQSGDALPSAGPRPAKGGSGSGSCGHAAAMQCSLGTAKNRVRWGLMRMSELLAEVGAAATLLDHADWPGEARSPPAEENDDVRAMLSLYAG